MAQAIDAVLRQLGPRQILDVRLAKKQTEHSWNSSGCFVRSSVELGGVGEALKEVHLWPKRDLCTKMRDCP
jgi:hypothetical protein